MSLSCCCIVHVFISLSFTKPDHFKCIHCYPVLSHAEAMDGGAALCSNLGGSDGVCCFLQSRNIYMTNYLFIHGQGLRLTTHLHVVLMLRLCGAVAPVPPICLHAMYRYSFTFAVCLPNMCFI